MGMKFIPYKCPTCGGMLQIQEGKTKVFCRFCGTPIFIEEELSEQKIKYDTKMRELELMESIERRRQETANAKILMIGIAAVIMLCVILIGVIFAFGVGRADSGDLGVVCLLVISLGLGGIFTLEELFGKKKDK